MGMKLLITGGAGFIGSHLTEALVARGDEVVILDEFNDYYNPAIKRRNLAAVRDDRAVTVIEGDIRDMELLKRIFDKHSFDVVVHLAARAGVRPSLEDPLLYGEVNFRGTLNILETMRSHGLRRLVFASSSSVYGNPEESPFKEEARIDKPISPYAATKAAGELLCFNYFHLFRISTNALRFFTVYGPRQRPDMAIHKFTALIDQGKPLPFYGDGSTERDYTFYRDIIAGIIASIDRDLGFEIFNLGESRTTTLSELVGLIEANVGKKAILDRQPMQPGDVLRTCADVSKARRLLGYNPTTSMEEGVRAFVAWYREMRSR
jgi:UDP-glucuronate 4-epimerase